jgi:hypothetical protein
VAGLPPQVRLNILICKNWFAIKYKNKVFILIKLLHHSKCYYLSTVWHYAYFNSSRPSCTPVTATILMRQIVELFCF